VPRAYLTVVLAGQQRPRALSRPALSKPRFACGAGRRNSERMHGAQGHDGAFDIKRPAADALTHLEQSDDGLPVRAEQGY